MSHFKDLYKTWATDELLDILDKPEDYQPLAVEAAQSEITSRNLSPELLEAARAIQAGRQKVKDEAAQKAQARRDNIKRIGTALSETLQPIETGTLTTNKVILRITILFGFLFLYSIYTQFSFLRFMITSDKSDMDMSIVFYFFPLIVIPLGGTLFWLRKTLGWFLVTLFSVSSAGGTIPGLIMELNRKPSGFPVMDILSPPVSPAVYILTALIYGQTVWYLCKQDMRAVYSIDKKLLYWTIGVGLSIPIAFLLMLLG